MVYIYIWIFFVSGYLKLFYMIEIFYEFVVSKIKMYYVIYVWLFVNFINIYFY